MRNEDKLMAVIDKIIELELPVDMRHYRSDYTGHSVDFIEVHNCGTAGCIAGWCPVLGEGDLKPIEEDFCLEGLEFGSYLERVFWMEDEDYRHVYEWLFSSFWPNCAKAAKVRLEYAMENGYPDENSYEPEEVLVIGDKGEWVIKEDMFFW